jgi:hypothetical protein
MAMVIGNPRGIAYSNGRWMAVGDSGNIVTSTNGTSWSFQTVVGKHMSMYYK